MELQDTYQGLDQTIASFSELSDKAVADNYLLFLTADHGGVVRKLLKDHKYNVTSINPKDIRTNLKGVLHKKDVSRFLPTQFPLIFFNMKHKVKT
jgi:hypothetical protein